MARVWDAKLHHDSYHEIQLHVNQILKCAPRRNFALFKNDITNFGYLLKNMATDMTFLFLSININSFRSYFLFANIIIDLYFTH